MVFSQAGTDHPDGWRFGFEILWRGLVYGSVDALTLFVFPAAVAYLLMHGNREGAKRKAGFAGLALLLSLLVSTSYHLGYPEYRDRTLRSPLIGTIVANVPTALTGNPLGAVVAHSSMHIAAVVHQREGGSTQMLPPMVTADYPSHGAATSPLGSLPCGCSSPQARVTVLVRLRHTPYPTTKEVAALPPPASPCTTTSSRAVHRPLRVTHLPHRARIITVLFSALLILISDEHPAHPPYGPRARVRHGVGRSMVSHRSSTPRGTASPTAWRGTEQTRQQTTGLGFRC